MSFKGINLTKTYNGRLHANSCRFLVTVLVQTFLRRIPTMTIKCRPPPRADEKYQNALCSRLMSDDFLQTSSQRPA